MSRSRLIFSRPPQPSAMDEARARFAKILIDSLYDNPTLELMDKIETLLWGRTFSKKVNDEE